MYDVEVMSLEEYSLQMQAHRLKQIDKEHDMHLQAWLNHGVTATKEQGKKQVPVYKTFKDFYDYQKRLKEVERPKTKLNIKNRHMAQIAMQVNAGKGAER